MFEIVRAAKRACEKDFLANKNVVGVGVGYKEAGGEKTGELAVIVSVVEKGTYRAGDKIPAAVQGIKTDIQQTGKFYALRTGKHRPAPGGVSIGHPSITAGTLGCLVRKGEEVFILSNNHVLAASNQADLGDPIVQPGSHDGGTVEADQIATLEDFVRVEFLFECPAAAATVWTLNALCRAIGSGYQYYAIRPQQAMNLVDAAIAKPLSPTLVIPEILEIGEPTGSVVGELGMEVQKSGRTTGLTAGKITQVDLTVQVLYGNNIALFTDQLQADAGCGGGDSGSAVLDLENRVVGLLFAGPEDGSSLIMSRFERVQELLGVFI